VSIRKPSWAAFAAVILLASAPAAGQTAAPAAPAPSSNPFRSLWTGWNGASRDALAAEAEAARRPEAVAAPESASTSVPAYSPLDPSSRAEAEALGARVGDVVRLGDCDEGERLARAAGDFALVRAVRDHCRRRDPSAG
jgi:hypothetical protein